MVYSNLLTFFLIFFASCSIHFVSAEWRRCIVGGESGKEKDFYYHVAIEGRKNQSQQYVRFGSGAIIGPQFVLAAALYFVDIGVLKNYTFSISAGYVHPRDTEHELKIDIDTIYLPGFDIFFSTFNIAVAKLKTVLDIGNNQRLMALDLPPPNELLPSSIGNLSAYDLLFPKLVCSKVHIIPPNICKDKFPRHNIPSTQMCGLWFWDILSVLRENQQVIDQGSPLVMNGVIVGIANLSPFLPNGINEDNYFYTRVSNFTEFIRAVMEGNAPTNFVYKNHLHVSWF